MMNKGTFEAIRQQRNEALDRAALLAGALHESNQKIAQLEGEVQTLRKKPAKPKKRKKK